MISSGDWKQGRKKSIYSKHAYVQEYTVGLCGLNSFVKKANVNLYFWLVLDRDFSVKSFAEIKLVSNK